jgi:hypothetical protein
VIWFPSWEDPRHVSLTELCSPFRKSIQFCKTIVTSSITLYEIRHTFIITILQCIKLITAVVCRIYSQLTESYLYSNFMQHIPTWKSNIHLISQEISCLSWNTKVYSRNLVYGTLCERDRTWNLQCVSICYISVKCACMAEDTIFRGYFIVG